PSSYLRQYVLGPLQKAADANPDDVRYRRWLADWNSVLWQVTHNDKDRDAALEHVHAAQLMDRISRDVWMTEAQLRTIFGRHLQLRAWDPTLALLTPWGPFPNLSLPPQPLGAYVRIFQEPTKTKAAQAAHLEFQQAAKALEHAVDLSPTQVRLRFQ